MKMIPRTHRAAITLLLTFCLFAIDVHAGNGCAAKFEAQYGPTGTLAAASCQTCHQGAGGPFNVYGADLRANGADGAGFNCDAGDFAAALVAVQELDSDGEGNSNFTEIMAGTQPGWCDTTASATCVNSPGTPPNAQLDPVAANETPTADAGGPYTGEAGTTLIQFDGSGSSDPENDLLSFAWNFGDGISGDGAMPTHTYAAAGTFEVSLVVSDGMTSSNPSVTTATITEPAINLAPVANPGGPYTGEPGQAVSFDGSASADPNGDALTYAWDFGDGAMGDGVTPSHVYVADGTYTVTLIVNDGEFDSDPATTTAEIATPVETSDGEVLYNDNCVGCHADPWGGPAVDGTLAGLRRVAGSRSCNIEGSIFGTSVFPNGVPEMQYLQKLGDAEIEAMAEYLNSKDTTGEQRYVTTCAGCHGNDGSGGRTGEDVRGESAHETWEAIEEESEMRFMACMPRSDIDMIAAFLGGPDGDDDHDDSHSAGGSTSLPFLMLLGLAGWLVRRRAA
jgi:PKD repeat protein